MHLIPAEKFTVDYINRIQRLFNIEEHSFIVYGQNRPEYRIEEVKELPMVKVVKTLFSDRILIKEIAKQSSLLVFHSLFLKTQDLVLMNSLINKLGLRACWSIWGKDLYEDYEAAKNSHGIMKLKAIYKESLRKKMIAHMCGFITTGDFDALKERYEIDNKAFVTGAQYTYHLLPHPQAPKRADGKIRVMIGHSATETCRHIETFNRLSGYCGKIKVYCPLSYPDDKIYISKVKNAGQRIFGDDFVAMTDYMDYIEYVDFLDTIDIGVFNNSRQQGMGNITNLLYLGKKVYLSEDNTINRSYSKGEYAIFDYNEIAGDSFLLPLTKVEAMKNKNKIEYKFSDENFKKEWERVFHG